MPRSTSTSGSVTGSAAAPAAGSATTPTATTPTATAPTGTPRDADARTPSDPTTSSDATIFVGRVDGAAVTVTVTPGSGVRPASETAGGPERAHAGNDGGYGNDYGDDVEDDEADEVTVRLRIEPPEPGQAAFTDLEPDEIRRLVDHLVMVASTRPAALRAAPDLVEGGDGGGDGESGGGARLTVVASEGTTAGGLRQALASVPAGARLRDFVTDTEVVLVFDSHRQQH